MQRHTQIYPAEKSARPWLGIAMLVMAAVLIVSGVAGRNGQSDLSITPLVSATPIPLDAAFDETMTEAEITLPGSTWYALQLGAFENEASALEMAQQFTRRGAAGYVWKDERYRALAAVYPAKEDAQQVRQQLETQHAVDTYLYEIDLPPVRIRMRGMQGQLDIFQAGFVHGNDLIVHLQRLCVLMDRQELDAGEAVDQLKALGEQMALVALRIKQRFQSPRHEAVEGIIACLEDYQAFCYGLDPHVSHVVLGTKIKHQTLVSLNGLKRVYDTLILRR